MPSEPPPPCLILDAHERETQVGLVVPRGWRLSPAGLAELRKLFRGGAPRSGNALVRDWYAAPVGGWCWTRHEDAVLIAVMASDIALEHAEADAR